MKAIAITDYGNASDLRLVETTLSTITEAEVLVRVYAAGINHIDSLKASGNIRQVYPLTFPWIPGADFSGVIVAIGSAVKGFKVGDEVYGSKAEGGAYAELIKVTPYLIAHKPKSLSHVEAAAIPMAAETAWQALFHHGAITPGQTVVISGAGGAVGICAIQLAHQAGIRTIALASAEQQDYLKQLGADEVVAYDKEEPLSDIRNADVVLDLVGGVLQAQLFEVIKKGGILIATNQPPSTQLADRFKVTAVFMHAKPTTPTLAKFADLLDQNKLKVPVAATYPMERAADAWGQIASNLDRPGTRRHPSPGKKRGKHVLIISGSEKAIQN